MNTATVTTTVESLPLASIAPDPSQPRKRFDGQALAELAASIESVGLLEPIIVRPAPVGRVLVDGIRWIIIAGERRWRAAGQAGLAEITAIVRDVDGAEAFELSMIENVVRADMNPIEEANGYQKLVDSGMTVAAIAARLGKPAGAITARLALLKLAEPVAKMVAVGQVDGFVAGHLARLTSEGQYRVIRAMEARPMGPLDAARLCTAVAAQEAEIVAFDDFMTAAPAVMTEPFVLPVVDRRESDLAVAIGRAKAALAEALELVGQDVAGDLAGIDEVQTLAASIGKAARRRQATELAKATR